MAIQYIESGSRMSQATIHGGTVYTAGQVASSASADAAGQSMRSGKTGQTGVEG